MGMFLSNVVFPPPASGTVTFLPFFFFFSYFCSNKTNSLQFLSGELCHDSPPPRGRVKVPLGVPCPRVLCWARALRFYFGRVWLLWAQSRTQGNESRLGTSQKQLYQNSVELSQAW